MGKHRKPDSENHESRHEPPAGNSQQSQDNRRDQPGAPGSGTHRKPQ